MTSASVPSFLYRVTAFFLVLLSVLFLHFVFARPLNYPLTLAPFAIVAALFALFYTKATLVVRGNFAAVVFLCALPLINAVGLGFSGGSFEQFLRTYALWLFATIPLLLAFVAQPRLYIDMATPAFFALFLLTILVGTQSELSRRGDFGLFNIFGSHQYFGEIELNTLAIDDRLRPPGLYLEPSFCAYVVISCWTICIISRRFRFSASLLAALSLFFVQSFTGFIAAAVLVSTFVLSRNSEQRQGALLGAGFAIIIGIAFASVYTDYLTDRVNQVFVVGSSTYYRTVAILPVLGDVLSQRPLGHALGQVREIIPAYAIPHGNSIGESIDNGFYLLVFYFGWFGLAFTAFCIASWGLLVSANKGDAALAVGCLFMGALFNGGVLLPEFILMSILVIYSVKVKDRAA